MKNHKHLERQIQCGWFCWSVVSKSQVIGVLAGVLLTIIIIVLAILFPPQFLSYSSIPIFVTMAPATLIAKAFGLPPHWFVDVKTGGLSFWPGCLIFIINGLLGLIIGTIIGYFVKYFLRGQERSMPPHS